MKIALANDHAALEMRNPVLEHLRQLGHEVLDFGTAENKSCHYPEMARKACTAVQNGEAELAVVICGTGIGISIAANKMNGIRCALCSDTYAARMARAHNNANCIALRGRFQAPENNLDIIDAFLGTEFEGGRHQTRIDIIHQIEQDERCDA
ncbi:ribose 5-phosphate isomerase B [Candidatus Sumerlaeota bacterium]|nr:ribose 5-phosphate isomerase B [Candidatus Sumerlaeota bacterium]